MQNDLTPAIYEAAKDPRIVALRHMPTDDIAGRLAKSQEIDANGTGPIVDPQIDTLTWDPLQTMLFRQSLGFTWWVNAMQPLPIVVHGGASSVVSNYDPAKPGPRSIKTTTDSADFPPFGGAPPPAPAVRPVGAFIGNGLYAANVAACWGGGHWLFSDGQQYTQDGATYVFHLVPGMFGPSINWTKV